ncbi:MAG: DUF956 family protein [Lachnospiraceae bacterium]|nr:DUF956 family protein [Lachnospiraceae bacterium]
MVESLNTKIDLVEKGTSYHGLTSYGKVMVGDKGFEYYDDRNINDYIQIPWEEVEYVAASVMFKGKKIPRFAFHTKRNGDFSFSTKEPKKVLRAVNKYIPDDKMLRSLTFMQVLRRRVKRFFHK